MPSSRSLFVTALTVTAHCALLTAHASAQTARITFTPAARGYHQQVWTTDDGLPQNSVNAIVQTRDGYLWIATFGGLARFDGVTFTVFDVAHDPGIRSNRITATVCGYSFLR